MLGKIALDVNQPNNDPLQFNQKKIPFPPRCRPLWHLTGYVGSMRLTVYAFVLLLVSKDLIFTPGPYVIRATVQSIALLIGLSWLWASRDGEVVRTLWPLWIYLLLLYASAAFSPYPAFSGLQVISLTACIVFFAGLAAHTKMAHADGDFDLARATLIAYTIVCGASLLVLLSFPEQAFEIIDAGDALGDISRFRGALSKSSMIGCAGGLLVGLCATVPRWLYFRIGASFLGLTCLYLAQARTMWVALAGAVLVVTWLYRPGLRKWVLIASLTTVVTTILLPENINFSVLPTDAQTVIRTESLENLDGRVELWSEGFAAIGKAPLLGYGPTLGALGLSPQLSPLGSRPSIRDLTGTSNRTMHNGILQALLDTGIPGAFAYLFVLLLAPIRLIWHDRRRRFPHVLFVLVFMTIANLGESVVYSAAVFDGVLYWGMVVFALTCRCRIGHSTQPRRTLLPNFIR